MARRVGCNRSGAGGMNPSPAHGGRFAVNVAGGGVLDAPRRGQDRALRCKRHMGGNGKAAGRACPAPTGRRGRVADERGKGGRQPAPFPVDGWQRKARRNPSGLASSASSPDGEPFCAGEARERSLPIRGGGREAGRRGSQACGWLPVNGLLRKAAGGIYAAPTELPFPPAGVRGNTRISKRRKARRR